MDSGDARQNQQLSLGSVSPQLLVVRGFVLLLRGILRAKNQPKAWPSSAGVSSAFKAWPVHARQQEFIKKGSFSCEKGYFQPAPGVLGPCRGWSCCGLHSRHRFASAFPNSAVLAGQFCVVPFPAGSAEAPGSLLLLAQFHAFSWLSCSLSSGLAQQSMLHLPAVSGKVLT